MKPNVSLNMGIVEHKKKPDADLKLCICLLKYANWYVFMLQRKYILHQTAFY